jgi:hypothetical protein
MKNISVILIIAYLMLPTLCFGHPCEIHSASAQQVFAADSENESPFNHDTDDCETTCCCAGHVQTPTFAANLNAPYISKLLAYDPMIVLPQVIANIVVPPQNHS